MRLAVHTTMVQVGLSMMSWNILTSCGHINRDFEIDAKRTFNLDKQGIIKFTFFQKLTMCRASEAWNIDSFLNEVSKVYPKINICYWKMSKKNVKDTHHWRSTLHWGLQIIITVVTKSILNPCIFEYKRYCHVNWKKPRYILPLILSTLYLLFIELTTFFHQSWLLNLKTFLHQQISVLIVWNIKQRFLYVTEEI